MNKRFTRCVTVFLVCAVVGCSDSSVDKPEAIQKHWSEMIRDSIDHYYDDEEISDMAVSQCSLVVFSLPFNYQEMIDFAGWCKKAHPDVWREYHSTITEE